MMTKNYNFFLCFVLLTLYFSLAYLQAQDLSRIDALPTHKTKTDSADAKMVKIARLTDFMHTLYEENQFNGSVLVLEKGEVLFHKAYGWANLEKRDTLTISTPFRLASVSKQFTSVATMMLYERGELGIDDKVQKYLPTFPYPEITIRHLLNHSSGLPDYFGMGWHIQKHFGETKMINNRDLLDYLVVYKPKLEFKSGRRSAYSNTGYVLLALIIENVSKMSYSAFLQKHIFNVAGMKNAFVYNCYGNFDLKSSIDTVQVKNDTIFASNNEMRIETTFKVVNKIISVPKRRAYGYENSFPYPQGMTLLDTHQFDAMVGEKGVCASTEDLIKWDLALRENKLLKPETWRIMVTPTTDGDYRDWDYGFGWKVLKKDNDVVYHHGLYRGFRTCLMRKQSEQTLVIVLANVQIGGKMSPIMDCLHQIMVGKKYKMPQATRLEKDTEASFKREYYINPALTK